MALSSWLCNSSSSSTTKMFVKIVYPGGRIELHDQPILASEIMHQNPRCCVAHPDVFRQNPRAVVTPDTVLMLGQKFYVVPISTLRKLRRLSWRITNTPSKHHELPSSNNGKGSRRCSSCMLFASPDTYNRCVDEDLDARSSAGCRRLCFKNWIERVKNNIGQAAAGGSMDDSCRLMRINKGRIQPSIAVKEIKGSSKLVRARLKNTSPVRFAYQWKPSLESISEE